MKKKKTKYVIPRIDIRRVKMEGVIAQSTDPNTTSVQYNEYIQEPEVERDVVLL